MPTPTLSAADWSQLEHYSDNLLLPADRAAVEARLATDAALRVALAEHQAVVSAIRADGRAAVRQRLSQLESDLRNAPSTTATTVVAAPAEAAPAQAAPAPHLPAASAAAPAAMRVSWVAHWRTVAAAALVVAGGVGTWAVLRPSNSQALADRYVVADPGLPVLMSQPGAATRPLLNQAMNAYKLRDPATALAAWDALPAGAVGADTLLFYRGLFQLQLHHNEAAAAALVRVRRLPASAFRERADYYFAVALWAQGRTPEAQAAFEQLLTVPGHPYAAAARTALEQLH